MREGDCSSICWYSGISDLGWATSIAGARSFIQDSHRCRGPRTKNRHAGQDMELYLGSAPVDGSAVSPSL